MAPVLILTCPRSGSSMVAGIFSRHGLWTGTCRGPSKINPKGFFENTALKAYLVKRAPALARDCRHAPEGDYRSEIESVLRGDGWDGERWLFKTSPFYLPFFRSFAPVVVKIRRKRASVIASGIAARMLPGDVGRIVDGHIEALAPIMGAEVDADAVVRGNDRSLKAAIEYAGLEYDPEIVRDFVNPEHWHH